jgi:hypothetical protein
VFEQQAQTLRVIIKNQNAPLLWLCCGGLQAPHLLDDEDPPRAKTAVSVCAHTASQIRLMISDGQLRERRAIAKAFPFHNSRYADHHVVAMARPGGIIANPQGNVAIVVKPVQTRRTSSIGL